MKYIAFLGLVFVSFGAVAQQEQTTLQLDSLTLKLQEALALRKDIEIQEIKGVYKLTAWHFVPSVSYLPIYDRPAHKSIFVTFSTTPFVSHMLGKRQEVRRISAIERRYASLEHTQEIRLKTIYLQINQRITNLNLSQVILLNDIEIYKIKIQQHDNHEIDTESFLRERSSILNKIKSHNTDVTDIQRFLLDIEQLTEYEVELDLFQFFVSPLAIDIGGAFSPLRGAQGGLP
jgi:hypothetical protein